MDRPVNVTGFYPGTCTENNVIHYFERHMKTKPDKDLFRWIADDAKASAGKALNPSLKHDSITIRQFHENVNRISRGLKAAGIGQGDRLILFVPMSVELYQIIFAIAKMGAVSVFLDTMGRLESISLSARQVAPKAIISSEQVLDMCALLPELDIPVKIVVGPHSGKYGRVYGDLLNYPEDLAIAAVDAEDTAIITFTSGSSGIPKGADRTHNFLAAQHITLSELIPYETDTVDFPAFPVFSLHDIISGIVTVIPGADVGQPKPEDPVILANQFLANKVSTCAISITMMKALCEYAGKEPLRFPDMRRVVTGGGAVSPDLLRDFIELVPNAQVVVGYGSTEVEPISIIEARELLSRSDKDTDGVCVGRIYNRVRIRFIKITRGRVALENDNWSALEVAPGEIGEIVVAGIHVLKRYYKNDEAARDIKFRDSHGDVWHRTGDLGYLDHEGNLWVLGRMHNVIMRNGQLLFPIRPEIILKRLDFVYKAAYVGVPDKTLGEKAYAVVTPKTPLADGDKAQAIASVRQLLTDEQVIFDDVLIAGDISMDPRHHSKVEYGILRDRILSGEIAP